MDLLEYVSKNKEWLFSGVGVVVVGFLANHFKKKESKSPPPQSQQPMVVVQINADSSSIPSVTTALPTTPISKVTNISWKEIFSRIKSAPPLQHDDIVKHYIGITVQWEAKLFSAKMETDDIVRVVLDFDDSETCIITSKVKLSDYRELGALQKGAPITVIGRIKDLDLPVITLETSQLFFHCAIS